MGNKTSEKKKADEELKFSSKTFDENIYNQVASLATLDELSLIESNFKIDLDCFNDAETSDTNLKHGFGGALTSFKYDSENGLAGGVFTWKAEVKFGRKKALKLSAEYYLGYNNLDDQDLQYVRLYFAKVPRFVSYPYFRTLFAVQTSNAGLQLSPLPSLRERMD